MSRATQTGTLGTGTNLSGYRVNQELVVIQRHCS
jgi:hypothetical protein